MNMNKFNKMVSAAFVLGAMFLMASCGPTLKVTNDLDKTANFSTYKTFTVYNLKTTGSVSQMNADRIVAAIRAEMVKKGYKEGGDNADLKVNAVTIIKDKQQVSSSTNYYGYGGLYRPYGYYGGMGMGANTSVSTYDYKAGTFIIDVVDAKTNKMIWEGVGSADFDKAPKDPDTAVPAGVARIMESLPSNGSK
jgi:hypothetical protein